MAAYSAQGIVLKRVSLGETDRIVTFLTREKGKLNAVAKGSRRPGSRFAGTTELFTYAKLLLATGRSLELLSQCESTDSFRGLRSDLDRMSRATYLCELSDRFTEEREAEPDVFDLLLAALYLLQRQEVVPDVVVHSFELRLMTLRGYAPQLDKCIRCGSKVLSMMQSFHPKAGGLLCDSHAATSGDCVQMTAAAMEYMSFLQIAPVESIIATQPDRNVLRQVDCAMRAFVVSRADRPLKSAEFLDLLRSTNPDN